MCQSIPGARYAGGRSDADGGTHRLGVTDMGGRWLSIWEERHRLGAWRKRLGENRVEVSWHWEV